MATRGRPAPLLRSGGVPGWWRASHVPRVGLRCLAAAALALVACQDGMPPPPVESSPTLVADAAAPTASASVSASASAPPTPALVPEHIERARLDTLTRAPALRRDPRVRAFYAPAVRQILEEPDEVVLFSVSWLGADPPLTAVIQGSAGSEQGVVGQLPLPKEGWQVATAWLFDGVTRPFGGSRCNQPHHALLYRRGKDAVAIAICFECGTLAMQTTLRGVAPRRANLRWDPAFRNYLRHLLVSAHIADLSSDIRP